MSDRPSQWMWPGNHDGPWWKHNPSFGHILLTFLAATVPWSFIVSSWLPTLHLLVELVGSIVFILFAMGLSEAVYHKVLRR